MKISRSTHPPGTIWEGGGFKVYPPPRLQTIIGIHGRCGKYIIYTQGSKSICPPILAQAAGETQILSTKGRAGLSTKGRVGSKGMDRKDN